MIPVRRIGQELAEHETLPAKPSPSDLQLSQEVSCLELSTRAALRAHHESCSQAFVGVLELVFLSPSGEITLTFHRPGFSQESSTWDQL